MLKINPVKEEQAKDKILDIYHSIKETFQLERVPLVFQYIASFPEYFSYLWNQAENNFRDYNFQRQCAEISFFSQKAIAEIYTPNTLTQIFLEKIHFRPEEKTLKQFVENNSRLHSHLYLFSLAIRESLKGKFLGIKQIGERITLNDSILSDLSDGFPLSQNVEKKSESKIAVDSKSLDQSSNTAIATSLYSDFFGKMDLEMQRLITREEYLYRRVELERFALSRLHLITHPLESSFATVIRQSSHQENFPELIYLLSEVFPTQSPYKLMASAVMKKALEDKPAG